MARIKNNGIKYFISVSNAVWVKAVHGGRNFTRMLKVNHGLVAKLAVLTYQISLF